MRGALPEDYLEPVKIRQIISELLDKLHIEKNETYQGTFFKATNIVEIVRPVSHEGVTDRIEISRKFMPPPR
jgi:hypothetical protein